MTKLKNYLYWYLKYADNKDTGGSKVQIKRPPGSKVRGDVQRMTQRPGLLSDASLNFNFQYYWAADQV